MPVWNQYLVSMTEVVMESLILRSLLRFSLVEGLISRNQNQQKQLGSIEWPNPKSNHAKINPKILVHSNLSSFSEIKLRQGELEEWLVYNVSLKSWMMIGQEHSLKLNSAKLVEISKQEFPTTMCQFYSVHSISTEMVFLASMSLFLQSGESLTREDSEQYKKLSK